MTTLTTLGCAFVKALERHLFRDYLAAMFILLVFVAACDDGAQPYARRTLPATGDAQADWLLNAMLNQDEATIRRLWNELGTFPCVGLGRPGEPKCVGGETEGELVRGGAFSCGAGAIRLDALAVGVPSDWDVFSIQVEEGRGKRYRVVFSRHADRGAPAVVIEFRTPARTLEPLVPFAFISYSETCETAGELTMGLDNFLVPPPHESN